MRTLRVLIAIGIGVALADASIVTLALPELLIDLDTGVEGVAAVIGVYTLALALALPLAALARRAVSDPVLGAVGFAVFAVAGGFCAAADTLTSMLVFRTLQALGAAAALVGGFALLRGGRLWIAAAVFGTAVGPALGGALTQAFDWRAIFEFQVPVGLVAAAAAAAWAAVPRLAVDRDAAAGPATAPRRPRPGHRQRRRALGRPGGRRRRGGGRPRGGGARHARGRRRRLRPSRGLGRARRALGRAHRRAVPARAAARLRLVARAAHRRARRLGAPRGGGRRRADPRRARRPGRAPAARSSAAACSRSPWLPDAQVAWIILPQILAGAGMGMALPALAGELLPEKTAGQAARLLSFRHAGITIALLILAPIAAGQLDSTVSDVREKGAALVLDARLPPLDKIEMAGPLVADLDPTDARDGLERALQGQAHRFADDPEDKAEFAKLTERADDVLVGAIDDAFSTAFLITGALALLGAVAVLPRRPRALAVTGAVAAAALALPVFHAIVQPQVEPEPVVIADPCKDRALPDTGGITGFLQDRALELLDGAACRFGSSREALVLALADEGDARAYQAKYGVDPRSTRGILEGVGINLP